MHPPPRLPPRATQVVLLGEGRVGKTSLLLRYVSDVFSDTQPATIQASYLTKRIAIDGGGSSGPHPLPTDPRARQCKARAYSEPYSLDPKPSTLNPIPWSGNVRDEIACVLAGNLKSQTLDPGP
jgi:GTPase SAR1 family protein